jgi:hypothetical protein
MEAPCSWADREQQFSSLMHLTRNQQNFMRPFLLLCLCLTSLTGQQTSTPNAGSDAQSNQQKARAVLDQMIKAMGGQAYLNVQDSYTEGRYGRYHNEVMIATNTFYRYWKWPGLERYEITKERDIAYLYLPGKVYEITFRGGHEQDPQKEELVRQALVRRRFTMDKVLRGWLNAPGTILLDEGPTLAENQMAERITIINADNDAVSILVLTDTHLPVQKIFGNRDPRTRERDEEVETYGSWRVIDGVNTACSTQLKHNGALLRTEVITSGSYNIHPPDSYFTPKLINHDKK